MDVLRSPDIIFVPASGTPGKATTGRVDGANAATFGREPASAAGPSAADTRARDLELRGLVKDMAARPPVDTARVAALKAQIANGRFTVDPARVADAMLGSLKGGKV